VFLEKGMPRQVTIRGAVIDAAYQARWFNPRNGEWTAIGNGTLAANTAGRIDLPARPSEDDWGVCLQLKK